MFLTCLDQASLDFAPGNREVRGLAWLKLVVKGMTLEVTRSIIAYFVCFIEGEQAAKGFGSQQRGLACS